MPEAQITHQLSTIVDVERPDVVDVAVEFQHAPVPAVRSKADRKEAIEGLQRAFELAAKPVIDTIVRSGGTVHASAWLNDTVYATVAPTLVHTLKKFAGVKRLDVADSVSFSDGAR